MTTQGSEKLLQDIVSGKKPLHTLIGKMFEGRFGTHRLAGAITLAHITSTNSLILTVSNGSHLTYDSNNGLRYSEPILEGFFAPSTDFFLV